jgi:hypothetical protein
VDTAGEIARLALPYEWTAAPAKDNMWNLHRATAVDGPNGSLIGKYKRRGDASKVVAQVSFE